MWRLNMVSVMSKRDGRGAVRAAAWRGIECLERRELLSAAVGAAGVGDPRGWVDHISPTLVYGWAQDPDVPTNSILVRLDIDGSPYNTVWTDILRSDVNAAISTTGAHGFSVTVPNTLSSGTHIFSVYALDADTLEPTLLRTKALTINDTPKGWMDGVVSGAVTGWAYDTDEGVNPVSVRVKIDGVTRGTVLASLERKDVNSQFEVEGDHGFSFALPENLSVGTHTVEAYVLEPNSLNEILLGSSVSTVEVRASNTVPKGFVDGSNATDIFGWAYDADEANSMIQMRLRVDGEVRETKWTTISRYDVNWAEGIDGSHGVAFAVPGDLSAGYHTLSMYALDSWTGEEVLVGSRALVLGSGPAGYVDSASTSDVRGWAYEPAAQGVSTTMQLYVDGFLFGGGLADLARPDLNDLLGISGNHGFLLNVSGLNVGVHTLEVYALANGTGDPYLIGTRVVTA